jgi:hypothetical protein
MKNFNKKWPEIVIQMMKKKYFHHSCEKLNPIHSASCEKKTEPKLS